MNPYKFIGILLWSLMEHVVGFIFGVIALIVIGMVFLFDKCIRDGRHKSWKI